MLFLLLSTLSVDDAIQRALQQASAYQQALTEEQSARLDVAQARAAALPKLRSVSAVTLNQPIHPGSDEPAFISADAVRHYQELAGVEGTLDFGLRAAIARSRALLAAAHAGTEIARRALVRSAREAYYGLALARAKRAAAEESVAAAAELERVTALQQSGGEVPEVDVIRARLQTAQRRDELEQARAQEAIAAASLRVLIGFGPAEEMTISELTSRPAATDIARYSNAGRPELVQAEAQLRAAQAEVGVARAERLPSLTYSLDEGFDAASLRASDLRGHSGYLAVANLNVPIFDWGIGRAKQRQTELRARAAEMQLALTRRQLEHDLARASEEARAALRRVENARTAVEDARKNAEVSIARYRAGEASILEVTDALTTLAQQRANEQQARADFEMARARLQEAAGE